MPDKEGEDTQRMARHWPSAQERMLWRWSGAKHRGAAPSESGPKEVDVYLGACEVTYSLQVGKASRAGLAWGLPQPALPRLFCSKGHLRREERKGSL